MRALLIIVACSFTFVGCRADEGRASLQRDLERRLLAPCCWRQTLEDHTSPTASTLRAEIGQRLAAGEDVASIEAELVERHGERIRALPEGGDPKWLITAVSGAAAVLGLVGLFGFVRRHRVAPGSPAPLAGEPQPDAYLVARLDDELLDID